MSYGCPVCNAFITLSETCNQCGSPMADQGRYSDYFGDYSPYRPIEDMKLSDGIADNKQNHECAHVSTCSACNHSQLVLVKEIVLPE